MMFSFVDLEPCRNAQTEVTGQAPSVQPPDVSTFNFQSDDDIRNSMLTASDVAAVISSYEKTIGVPFVCCSYDLLEILSLSSSSSSSTNFMATLVSNKTSGPQ